MLIIALLDKLAQMRLFLPISFSLGHGRAMKRGVLVVAKAQDRAKASVGSEDERMTKKVVRICFFCWFVCLHIYYYTVFILSIMISTNYPHQ